MAFPFVYPQAVVRLEGISTYITFECVFSILLHSTGAGFCFLCRNASFRLAFLLSVDGLDFFLVLPVVAKARPLSLVSREKEKLELIVREKLKAKPWPDVQAFGCQGGVTFIHRSHCGKLLN